MPQPDRWTRDQLIIALKLYCEIPFGKMHARNPEIIRFAKWIDRTPSALAMKLTNFASLDPKITSSGRKGLSSVSHTDRAIWTEATSNWNGLMSEIGIAEERFRSRQADEAEAEESISYLGRTKKTTIEARIGQDFFRRAVLSAYSFKCCISGVKLEEVLVASHIVPWRVDPSNRLNPRNGLCLSAIHDRAFDLGLIAVSDDFRVLLSKKITASTLDEFSTLAFKRFEGKQINLPTKFMPDPKLLRQHRELFDCNF